MFHFPSLAHPTQPSLCQGQLAVKGSCLVEAEVSAYQQENSDWGGDIPQPEEGECEGCVGEDRTQVHSGTQVPQELKGHWSEIHFSSAAWGGGVLWNTPLPGISEATMILGGPYNMHQCLQIKLKVECIGVEVAVYLMSPDDVMQGALAAWGSVGRDSERPLTSRKHLMRINLTDTQGGFGFSPCVVWFLPGAQLDGAYPLWAGSTSCAPQPLMQQRLSVLSRVYMSPAVLPAIELKPTWSQDVWVVTDKDGASSVPLPPREGIGHQLTYPVHALALFQHHAHAPRPPGQFPRDGQWGPSGQDSTGSLQVFWASPLAGTGQCSLLDDPCLEPLLLACDLRSCPCFFFFFSFVLPPISC